MLPAKTRYNIGEVDQLLSGRLISERELDKWFMCDLKMVDL